MSRSTPMSVLSLVAVAVLAAVGWRVELEVHGWAGLDWLTWFHWAIPAGAALFAGWLYAFSGVRPTARWGMLAGFAALTAIAYVVEHDALRVIYSRLMPDPTTAKIAITTSLAAFWLYPVALWALGRALGARIRLNIALLSVLLYGAGFPIAVSLLDVVGHVGGADFIHAVKSGFAIPLLVIPLGLPFALTREDPDQA